MQHAICDVVVIQCICQYVQHFLPLPQPSAAYSISDLISLKSTVYVHTIMSLDPINIIFFSQTALLCAL